ncbi:putative ribonuclease H-like domain-containing protein [Tanacetum coccineum]
MNYEPVTAGNQTNGDAGIETNVNAGQAGQEKASDHEYILLPLMLSNSPLSLSTQSTDDKDADEVPDKGDDDVSQRNGQEKEGGASNKEDDQHVQDFRAELDSLLIQQKEGYANSTNRDSTDSPSVSTVGPSINTASENINTGSLNINTASPIPNDSSMQSLENTGIFDDAYDDREVGAEADLNNLETTMNVSPIPNNRRISTKDHPIRPRSNRNINSATQTRRMTKIFEEHAMVSYIKKQRRTNHKDYQNCLFACFLSQIEPKKVIQALTDPSWIEAMQEELLNKQDERGIVFKRGIVVRNKARLMDVKSAFLYGNIEEEVYVCQPLGFEDPHFPDKVYKVVKALYGLHQAPRAWYETLSTYLLENGFRRGTIDKTLFIKKEKSDILLVQVYVDDIIFRSTKKTLCLEFEHMMHKRFQMSSMGELTFFLGQQVQQKEDGIFISQDKYVADILKKFDYVTVKTASTPMEPNKALVKDEEADNVVVHLYISMIGSLMYLTISRPDITFAVCAYARDSPFDLEAFLDSDYAGASLDRKSTTRGCQFLGKRLISWQCKKQTIVANSITKEEYVASANCYGQGARDHGGASTKLGLRGHLNCLMIYHSEEGSSFGNRLKADKEDDDMALEDSSKQGRMIEEIDQDVGVTLVTPTKVSSQEDQPEYQLGVLSAAKRNARDAEVAQRLQKNFDAAEGKKTLKWPQNTSSSSGFTGGMYGEDIRARLEAQREMLNKNLIKKVQRDKRDWICSLNKTDENQNDELSFKTNYKWSFDHSSPKKEEVEALTTKIPNHDWEVFLMTQEFIGRSSD